MEPESHSSFGDLIRRYRLRAGLTQQELADRAGLSARAITTLERGERRTPRKATVELLASALLLTVADRERLDLSVRRSGHVRGSAPSRGERQSPLVGRERERATLRRSFANDGPMVMFLAGEPGIGKTRLLTDVADYARTRGWSVLSGGCRRGGVAEPYAPLPDALYRHLARESMALQRNELEGCRWLARILPELVERDVVTLPAWSLPPEQERRLIFEALLRFLSNCAGPRGTLLTLDDLHWADVDTFEALSALAHAKRFTPLRIVATYRTTDVDERSPLVTALRDLSAQGYANELRVGPLSARHARDLALTLIGETPQVSAEQLDHALRVAAGVPFYVVSYAESLRTHAVEQPTHDAEERQAPQTPWDIVQSITQRIAALPQATQQMVRVASITDRAIARDILLAVAAPGLPNDVALDALEAACRAGLLEAASYDSYSLAHDLIGEVVSKQVSPARRAALHLRLAEALRQGSAEAPAETLAYHYLRAGDRAQATMFLELAGDHAERMQAHAAAGAHYEELIALFNQLDQPLQAARALEKLGKVAINLARYDRALACFEEAARYHGAAADTEGVWRCVAYIGRIHARSGAIAAGINRLTPFLSLETGDDTTVSAGRALLAATLASLYVAAGRIDDALRATQLAEELAQGLADKSTLAEAIRWRGVALLLAGRLTDGAAVLEQVVALCEESGDLWGVAHALNYVSYACAVGGMMARCGAYHRRALDTAERLGDPSLIAFVLVNRAEIAFYQGDWAAAQRDGERALAVAKAAGSSWAAAIPLSFVGGLRAVRGELREANESFGEAVSCLPKGADRGVRQTVAVVQAEIDLVQGNAASARDRLSSLADQSLIHNPIAASARALLAWAMLELGDTHQAESQLAQITEVASAIHNHITLIEAMRVRVLLEMRRAAWEKAERIGRDALELARSTPYVYGEAKVLYAWGLLEQLRGRHTPARDRLREALDVLQPRGERLYAQECAKALSRLSVAAQIK